jgi:hypothetical protein
MGIKQVDMHNNQYASYSQSSRIFTDLHYLLNTENINSDYGISDPLSSGNECISLEALVSCFMYHEISYALTYSALNLFASK